MGGRLSQGKNDDEELKDAVSCGRWRDVWWLFYRWRLNKRRLGAACRAFAVEQACQHADDFWCAVIVAQCPDVPDVQSVALLTVAVRRGLWETVSRLLEQVSANDNRDIVRWAVEEACNHAPDEECADITRHCADNQTGTMLTVAVRRGLWKTVCRLLQRVTSNDNRDTVRWAVEEACDFAPDKECADITRHCADDQTDTLLTVAVRRGLWETVSRLLELASVHDNRDAVSWAVEEFPECDDNDRCVFIAASSPENLADKVLIETVRQGRWETVSKLLSGAHFSNRDTVRWVVEKACNHAPDEECADITRHCADDQTGTLLTVAARRGLWKTVRVLLVWTTENRDSSTSWAQCRAVEEAYKRADDETFRIIAHNVVYGNVNSFSPTAPSTRLSGGGSKAERVNRSSVPTRVAPEHRALLVGLLRKRGLDRMATDIIQDTWKELGRSERTEDKLSVWARLLVHSLSAHSANHTDVSGAALTLREYLDSVTEFHDKVITEIVSVMADRNDRFTLKVKDNVWRGMRSVLQHTSNRDTDACVHFFKWCVQRRGRTTSLCQLSLPLVASQTVNLALQSLARTSMWEETRRWYLQFLVEEKLWDIVKEVADHSVYDDQRAWALGQAHQDKQWDVVVLLADHGLTEKRRYRVYRQVAKYASWATVRLLFERAVDMRRVCEELMAGNPCRDRPPGKIDRDDTERSRLRGENVTKLEKWYRERSESVARLTLQHNQRCRELERLEKRQARAGKDFMSLLTARKWYAVLSQLRQNDVSEERIELTLQHAIQSEAWSVVAQLVRLGMDAAKGDKLFSETIRRRQWGVVRTLLEHVVSEECIRSEHGLSEGWSPSEHGVSVEVSQAAVPELMQRKQWLLVARVMEMSLDDTDRRRVMQAALDKKEGSVVAHGISVMEGRVSVGERQDMYEQALGQGTWQTVKRLVEDKDITGKEQRDQALVAAVDRHRWDMVDHCVLQGADINKQDADGDTMLHEKAEEEDWDSVDGLLYCGAKPNLQNRWGYSAFHITVYKALADHRGKIAPWDAVKTSVMFHGNLNQSDPTGCTPLYMLIDCGDRHTERAGRILEEALWWGSDVSQRVDCGGKTALHVVCQAGLWHSMQYISARGGNPLGVTDHGDSVLTIAVGYNIHIQDVHPRGCRQRLVAECISLGISTHQPLLTDGNTRRPRSCVYISVVYSDPVVLRMLYESGACTHRELLAVLDQPPGDHFPLLKKDPSYNHCLSYLEKVTSTPRSLQSSCRLLISHLLGVGKPRTRQKKVKKLPLTGLLRDYVLFSDLMHPDFGKDIWQEMDGDRYTDIGTDSDTDTYSDDSTF